MKKELQKIISKSKPISREIAFKVLAHGKEFLPDILFTTNLLRETTFQNRISFCQILNIKSGNCSEDCRFCAQSKLAQPQPQETVLASLDEIHKNLISAVTPFTKYVGLVSSGRGLPKTEVKIVCEAIQKAPSSVKYCTSLGILKKESLDLLKAAGVSRYHHNLETSERFFSEICQTHFWQERWNTLVFAKEAGLSICSGGILGVGETMKDRVDKGN